MVSAGVLNPPLEDVLIDEVGEECCDRGAVHNGDPPKEYHHYCVYFLKLVAIGEDLVHQLQLVVEKYLTLPPLSPLTQVDWRSTAEVLDH